MEGLGKTDLLLENILQGITDSVLLLSKDLKILWANKAFQNQTGYKREEIIGDYCYRFTHHQGVPCQSPQDLCPASEAERIGSTATTTHTHFDKEGNKIFVEVSAYPVKNEKGEIIQFVCMYRDVTEMKKVEEDLRNALYESGKRQAEILALLEGSRAILKYHDFHSAARSIFDSCKDLIGATSGYIALLSKDGTENEVLFLDPGGLPCTVDPTLPMPIRGLRGEAYHNVKTVYHNDFFRSEWMKFMPEGHVRLNNVLFAPMVVDGKAVGLLGIANKPGGFTEDDARMASAFGELAAIALLNKRAEEVLRRAHDELEMRIKERTAELEKVNEELLTEITERKRIEGALRRSEASLSEAQRVAHLGNWDWNIQTNQLHWSDEIYRIFGLSPQQFGATYEAFLDSVHPGDREFVKRAVNEALYEKRPYSIDHRIVLPDGAVRIVHEQAEVTFDEAGKPIRMLGTVQDITDRKKAEEELKKSYEQLRNLSAHLQSVREEERTNIAREIHDELGQALTALKIDISMLASKLYPDHKPLLEKAESMIKRIDDTIQTVRRICTELRPTILDHFGLSAAIEWQGGEFKSQTGIRCDVSLEPKEIILDQDLSTAVFRIFQEALTNAARHAKATEVKVSLKEKDDEIMLEVKDNGIGIAENQISDPKSFGLMGIKERVNFLGGDVKIDGVRDKGTNIKVRIPLKKEKKGHDKNSHC